MLLRSTSPRSFRPAFGFTLLLLSLALAHPALTRADESLFGYSYGQDTQPKGQGEYAVWATERWDKQLGSYNATDLLLEYEYGLSDRLSASVYLQGLRLTSRDAWPLNTEGEEVYPSDINLTKVASIKGALKYNFLSVYEHPVGISFVWEIYYTGWYPKVDGAKTEQLSFEPKLIVQKNFLDDTLVWVYNLGVESEWRRFPEDDAYENEFSITNSTGLSYRFAPNWFGGVEARHHQDILNGEWNHHDFFAGPTLHYGAKKWNFTLSYLRQLYGNPSWSGYDVDPVLYPDNRFHLEEDTKNELRLKVGTNF